MKVALVSLHFAEYAARIALALAERHTVQLHLSRPNAMAELTPALLGALRQHTDLRLHAHASRKRAPLQGAHIALALRRFAPDVIHMQEAGVWSAMVAWRLGPGVPLVYTVHDPSPHAGADESVYRRMAWPLRRLRAGASRIIVHGASLIAALERAEPALAGKVHAVMHGTLGETPARAPEREPRRVLFFGRIEAYKGLGVLVEAARRLHRRGVDFELVVAGRGADLESHRSALAALPRVRLLDYFIPADEAAALFASSGAVIAPYLEATQSGVVANAFAAGTPVIASDVGALAEVVRDGENGLLVPPGDAAALADAMAQVLESPELALRLGKGAADTANRQLAWPVIARETEAVYRRAVDDGS